MSHDELNDLIMGAVLVVLGYAVYQHYKKPAVSRTGAATSATYSALGPVQQQNTGVSTDPTNPGMFIGLSDLLKGAVHDINSNGSAVTPVPLTSDLVWNTVSDTVNPNQQGPAPSMARDPLAPW